MGESVRESVGRFTIDVGLVGGWGGWLMETCWEGFLYWREGWLVGRFPPLESALNCINKENGYTCIGNHMWVYIT